MAIKRSIVDVWFYVNPENDNIDAAVCLFPFGVSTRQDNDWVMSTKAELGLTTTLANHDVYQLTWESDPIEITPEFDFDDYESSNHMAVKLYDKGELDLETLKKHSDLIVEGKDIEIVDAEDIEE